MPKDEELSVREEKEAHSRAVILESSTEEETHYIIFSRFGTVTSAEIIKDHKTGDSHCYAFNELEDKESFDFSQSVEKLWSQYRPRNKRGSGRFNNGSVDAIKQQKEDNKQYGYSKFLRRRKETRKQHRRITKSR
ncbi:hypothetical protein R3W88_024263 [Solanum pinnatisectum]|uniref:peptidylprolyl isomerase n=1 Tax=Solanum pinnatisectum TaxID=50273 RepID=A0AAV9LZS5_9SOLN|nr:hypothetical protein R3W88_024263 [Solanum pinnatisectum]